MDKIVDHIFVLRPGGSIKDFNGNYSEYKLREHEFADVIKPDGKESENGKELEQELKKIRNNPTQKKLSFNDQHRMKQIEKELADFEARKKVITDQFSDTSLSSAKMEELSKEMGVIMSSIEELEFEWMEIADKV